MIAGNTAPPMIEATNKEEPSLVYGPQVLDAQRKNSWKHNGMEKTFFK